MPHSRSTQSLASRTNDLHQPLRRQRSRPKTQSSQMLNGQKSMSILTPPREDRNDNRFDDIGTRLHETKFPRRLENSQPTTSTSSDTGNSSSAKKNASSSIVASEASGSAFKAGSFKERNTNSPRVLRKNSPFKAGVVSRVTESEGYEGSTESDHPTLARSSLLSKKDRSSNNLEVAAKNENTNEKPARASRNTENSPPPQSSEHLEAPVALRYNGQSPSEHLERVLSIHASPTAAVDTNTDMNKTPRFARYRATDPAHGFPTPNNKSAFHSSFSPSDDFSFNNNNSDDATPTIYNRSRYFKDPLKRISKAEDMASLQSLGQALASSTDGSDDMPPLSFSEQAAKYTDKNISTAGTRSPVESASVEMTSGRLPRSSMDKFRSDGVKAAEQAPVPITPTALRHRIPNPTNPANTPVTPKTEIKPAAPVFKGRLNSVKSLAAKFDNPQAQKPASPTHVSRLAAANKEKAANVETTPTQATVNKERGTPMLDKIPLATPSSVLASYTSNPSPSPSRASMKSGNSIKSTRSITMTQAQRDRRMQASENGSPRRTPAPRGSQAFNPGTYIANKIFRVSTSSPQSQNGKRSTQNSSDEKDSTSEKSTIATTSYGITPTIPGINDVGTFSGMTSSGMLPQGDANASVGHPRSSSISRPPSMPRMPRMLSMGRILPRPMEPPVAHYINTTRSQAELLRDSNSPSLGGDRNPSPTNSLISPTFFQPFTRMTPDGFQSGGFQNLQSEPGGVGLNTAWQGRGASMLHAQVTSMQKTLEMKNEEIDNLKRQLATKNSLDDLGTFSEQLREQKRETAMWRDRALTAEKRLERMIQLLPGGGGGQGSGGTGSSLSESNDRLKQTFRDIEAMEEAHAGATEHAQHMNEVDGAGETNTLPAAFPTTETVVRTTSQNPSGNNSESQSGWGSSSHSMAGSIPGSIPASIALPSSGSKSTSGSNSGSTSGSNSNDQHSNSTTIHTTMHGGGMNGVMSSEESERSGGSDHSNATQGTVLRRTIPRGSTVDLLDFGSEDSGVVLVQPLVPVMRGTWSGRSGEGEHVAELFELA